eukprot:COSAG05_NODE_2917_length_2511_cov_8.439884_2_plen_524_part_00
MSVIAVTNLLVERTTFSNTNGTKPSAGVDIEPDRFSQQLTNITFKDCTSIGNAGNGFSLDLFHFNQYSDPFSITLKNFTVVSAGENCFFIGYIKRRVRGLVQINRSHSAAAHTVSGCKESRCILEDMAAQDIPWNGSCIVNGHCPEDLIIRCGDGANNGVMVPSTQHNIDAAGAATSFSSSSTNSSSSNTQHGANEYDVDTGKLYEPVPQLSVPNCSTGVALATNFRLVNASGWPLAQHQTEMRLCHNASGLHIEGRAQYPLENLSVPTVTQCGRIEMMNRDDVMEVFLSPVHATIDDPKFYHELDTNAAGALWASLTNNSLGTVQNCHPTMSACNCSCAYVNSSKALPCRADGVPELPYTVCGLAPCSGRDQYASAQGLTVAVKHHTWGWSMQLSIPWGLFSTPPIKSGPAANSQSTWPLWRLNMYRISGGGDVIKSLRDIVPRAYSAWSPTMDPSFHTPSRFGVMLLKSDDETICGRRGGGVKRDFESETQRERERERESRWILCKDKVSSLLHSQSVLQL